MRLNVFGTKIIGIVAAGLLLAACETMPETGAAATGGAAQAAPSSQLAVQPTQQGPVPGSAQDFILNVGDRVFFDFDKFDLKPPARATLDRQAAWLKQYPNTSLSVEGHADERGTREYNLALGDRRATAAKNYLVSLGVSPNRLRTISYGKERPVALGSNEAAWSQNRRAVSVVN